MDRSTAVLVTLVAYKVVLLALGLLAQRRTKDASDFFLAGRRLGPLVAAISASASSSSAWTLLGVSGYAYANGLSAVWLFPSCVGGFALNWFVLAPRLRRYAAERPGALTVTALLAGDASSTGHRAIRAVASVIVLVSLVTYVASQFQASGKAFAETFELDATTSVLIGSAIVVAYTLLGGFWAVSLTDTLQGLVMAATAVVLPVAALVEVGGFDGLAAGLDRLGSPNYTSWTEGRETAAGIGLVVGFLGIGLGYPGQPHVVNRMMALADETAVRQARRYSMAWAVVVYAGMIVLGLCGRVIVDSLGDHENVFMALSNELFSPVVAGVMLAAVLSAIMSTADSQLLVAASAVSHDLGLGGSGRTQMLLRSRVVVLVLSVFAVLAALFGEATIFNKVLFAWAAMGCAFGPLLLVTVWRRRPPGPFVLAAMLAGFALSVGAYWTPELKGGVMERIVPFAVALAIAWFGLRRRS